MVLITSTLDECTSKTQKYNLIVYTIFPISYPFLINSWKEKFRNTKIICDFSMTTQNELREKIADPLQLYLITKSFQMISFFVDVSDFVGQFLEGDFERDIDNV